MQVRGVNVGQVARVKPSLSQVDVLVDVKDANTVIPRNSIIEANQSGLIATPIIDITPQLPVPDYKASTALVCFLRLWLSTSSLSEMDMPSRERQSWQGSIHWPKEGCELNYHIIRSVRRSSSFSQN